MKTKRKIKARSGVVGPDQDGQAVVQCLGLTMHSPVLVLPDTPEDYDAMVEQMAHGLWVWQEKRPAWSKLPPLFREAYRNQQRASLASIGITAPATRRSPDAHSPAYSGSTIHARLKRKDDRVRKDMDAATRRRAGR